MQKLIVTRKTRNKYIDLYHEAKELYKSSKENNEHTDDQKLIIFTRIVNIINQIPDAQKSDAAWRLLAHCQFWMHNVQPIKSKEIDLIIAAENSCRQIKTVKPKDRLNLATVLNKRACLSNQSEIDLLKEALATLNKVLFDNRNDEYYSTLTLIQYNLAQEYESFSEEQINWYKKAIESSDYINVKGDYDKMRRARMQCRMAENCLPQRLQVLYWSNACLATLTGVTESNKSEHLLLIVLCHIFIAKLEDDITKKRDALIKCLRELEEFRCHPLPAYYWTRLADVQKDIAQTYIDENWKLANDYYIAAIDSIKNIEKKDTNDFHDIKLVYKSLFKCNSKAIAKRIVSINQLIFDLGRDTLSTKQNNNYHNLKKVFLYLHSQLSKYNHAESNDALRALIQLMELIDSNVDQVEFPNMIVQNWLSQTNERQWFRDLLSKIKNLYQPLNLLNAIESAQNFSLAVSSELLLHRKSIATQEATANTQAKLIYALEERFSALSNDFQELKNDYIELQNENAHLKRSLSAITAEKSPFIYNAKLNLFSINSAPSAQNTQDCERSSKRICNI